MELNWIEDAGKIILFKQRIKNHFFYSFIIYKPSVTNKNGAHEVKTGSSLSSRILLAAKLNAYNLEPDTRQRGKIQRSGSTSFEKWVQKRGKHKDAGNFDRAFKSCSDMRLKVCYTKNHLSVQKFQQLQKAESRNLKRVDEV